MNTMLEYKDYFGSVEYSTEDELLHGKLEFIRDLVTYEGNDAKSIKAAFQEAVDDYLELCETQDSKPDMPHHQGSVPSSNLFRYSNRT